MKWRFTLLSILFFLQVNAQQPTNNLQELTGKVAGLAVTTRATTDTARLFIRCGRALQTGNEPLLVIDGIVTALGQLGGLNPNDIESISILKNAEATAIYGSSAVHGAIIITTKRSQLTQIFIKDETNGKPVPGATVSFIDHTKPDTLHFVASDSGKVSLKGLKMNHPYSVQVTSVGYHAVVTHWRNKLPGSDSIRLQRDYKIYSDAAVVVNCSGRIIRCGFRIEVIKTRTTETLCPGYNQLLVYPNPIPRGQTVMLSRNSAEEAVCNISILAMNGSQLLSVPWKLYKGVNRFSLTLPGGWSAGTYLINITNAQHTVIGTSRLIIQ